MKGYIALSVFVFISFIAFGQYNHSNALLIRHDTTLLNAADCEWIIKSLAKNDPALTSSIGKPVAFIILKAIENGKLKAFDRQTNKLIPGKEIFTWGRPKDSIATYDDAGNMKINAVQQYLSSDKITHIRIYHDWNFDVSTGKFQAVIKWIELMEDIYTSATGIFIGAAPLCRIYY